MKILVLSTNGIIKDGITEWMISYFRAMDKSGMQVHAVAYEGSDSDAIETVHSAGLEVHTLPSRKSIAEYRRALRKLMRDEAFDVVHVCGNSATVAIELSLAKAAGARMRIAHSHNTTCSHPFIDKLLRPAMHNALTDRYACGEAAGKWLFGDRLFTVIPNGKDVDRFRFCCDARARVRKSLGLVEGQIAIGHVGTFSEQKNHPFLFEIFRELRNRSDRYRLYLMGDGRARDHLKRTAEQLGIDASTAFLGWRDDVPDLLNAMDCMVFPSLFEGLPNVVVEWQINGLPCVLSADITRECAFTPLARFVPLSESVKVWADAIEASLADSDRECDCAAAVTAAIEAGYDIRKNAAMLRELYLEGLSR